MDTHQPQPKIHCPASLPCAAACTSCPRCAPRSRSCFPVPAAGGFAPIAYLQLKYSSATHAPQGLAGQGVSLCREQPLHLYGIRPMPFLRLKADLVPGSQTFRPGTGQKCLLQQMSLDRALLHHPLFQNHHFSSVRSQCPASGSAAPAPPLCLPLLMSPPSKWASAPHREPPPLFLAWELVLGVQRRGEARGISQHHAVYKSNKTFYCSFDQLLPSPVWGLPDHCCLF